MLSHFPKSRVLNRLRKGVAAVLRRPGKTSWSNGTAAAPWIDSMTPAWVADGMITASSQKTLLDVSSAFDVLKDT